MAASLHEPIVALINSGTQWGPIDGTSAVSQRIDLDFGLNNPGHVYVEASGDGGNIPVAVRLATAAGRPRPMAAST